MSTIQAEQNEIIRADIDSPLIVQVKQTTFIDFVYDLSGINYKLTSPDEKLVKLITHNMGSDREGDMALLRQVSEFKGSLEFRDMINRYVASLAQAFIPEQDFTLEEYTVFSVAHDYQIQMLLKALKICYIRVGAYLQRSGKGDKSTYQHGLYGSIRLWIGL